MKNQFYSEKPSSRALGALAPDAVAHLVAKEQKMLEKEFKMLLKEQKMLHCLKEQKMLHCFFCVSRARHTSKEPSNPSKRALLRKQKSPITQAKERLSASTGAPACQQKSPPLHAQVRQPQDLANSNKQADNKQQQTPTA